MSPPLTEDNVKNFRISSITLGFLMTVIVIVATIVWSVSSYSNKINRISDQVTELDQKIESNEILINELDEIIQEICEDELADY